MIMYFAAESDDMAFHVADPSVRLAHTLTATASNAWLQHAVPPHHRSGHKHGGGGQPEERPDRLGRLVTHAGAVTRNSDPVERGRSAERPANRSRGRQSANLICRGGRLQPVGGVLKNFGKAEIDAAHGETANRNPKLQKPIMLCRSQVRRFHSDAAVQCQTAAPCPDARPPDRETRNRRARAKRARRHHSPSGPVRPANRLSCRSMRLDTRRMPPGMDDPRSTPLRGSNSRYLGRLPRRSQTSTA